MARSVTVGIPTCNNEDTIERTLRQLLDGTRPPDRILVVDASTDRTPEIIDRVAAGADVPIDVYAQSDRGRGVGAARQDIYERFEGDLLACLDTNVRVGEEWLAEMVAFHEANPDCDVLSAAPVDVDGPVTDPKRGYFFQQSNCTVKREALDAVGGWDPWFQRGEDWDMGIRLWLAGRTAHARGGLDGHPMEPETQSEFRKALGRPSSVAYLRKYGPWYARFHPVHALGDALSVVSIVALVLAPVLAVLSPLLGLGAVGVTVALTLAFLWFHHVPHRDGLLLWPGDLRATPRFFLLGYTAIREFLAGDRPWNHGGVDWRAGDG